MRGVMRQRARRVCVVSAGMCLLLAVGMPSSNAQDDDVPPPEVFRGSAVSQVASVQVDRAGLLPIPDLFKFVALDGVSSFESSHREARSSLLFPGNGLILGPSLACGTFGGQFPPDFKPILDTCLQYKYPLTVFADDFAPDGATVGSLALGAPTDTVSANAIGAKAHVGDASATTDAVMQDLRLLGVPPFGAISPPIPGVEDSSLLTIDSATSRTNQRTVKGGLVTDAKATLSGIRMIGGLIKIESLVSTSRVTDDAKGKRTAAPSLVVSGVTVAGQPAQITDKGLILGPSANASPLDQQRQSQINGALEAMGIKVTVLDFEQSLSKGGAAVANVGGLLVEFGVDVQGLPTTPRFPDPRFPNTEVDPNGKYIGSIQLGTTGALGSAVNYGADAIDTGGDFPFLGDDPGSDLSSDGYDSGSGSYDVAAPDYTSAPSSGSGSVARPNASESPTQLARSIGGVFGDRIGLLYLALMFAVLACCIAPGFTVPSRFPGRSS